MSTPPALKPCPFCGGEAFYKMMYNDYTTYGKVAIGCKKCRVHRTNAATKKGVDWLLNKSIEEWNRRTP